MDYLGICFIGRSPEGGRGSGSIPGSSSKIAWPRFVKGLQDGEILLGSCPRVPRVGDCKVKGAFHFLMAAILGGKTVCTATGQPDAKPTALQLSKRPIDVAVLGAKNCNTTCKPFQHDTEID